MPVKTFLLITAVITAVLGVTLIAAPDFIAESFLPDGHPGAPIFIRFLGSTLFGYSYLNRMTALGHDLAVRPTLWGNFATLSVALAISLIGVLDGTLKATGWLIVALHAVFAAGFGWYLLHVKQLDQEN